MPLGFLLQAFGDTLILWDVITSLLFTAWVIAFSLDDLKFPFRKAVDAGHVESPLPSHEGAVPPDAEGESAAMCWSRMDGRFKHNGLREDPFNRRIGPPRFSMANLELPMPALSPAELAGTRELFARVGDLTAAGKRTDMGTMWRFLQARKGNVEGAEAYFRKAVAFRDSLNLDELDTSWDLEAYERCFAPWWCRGGILGHGKSGQVVGLERCGLSGFPELSLKLPWEVLVRMDAVHIVRSLAAFEEDALRRGVPVGNNTLILDLEGLSWDWCRPSVARMYGKLVEGRDMLLPNTLGHILVVRAPAAFTMAWRTAQSFFDATTREKVQIATTVEESLAMIRKYVPDEIIPGYLGGRLHTDGDPECRLLLGSSSPDPVPSEAFERLQALLSGDTEAAERWRRGAGADRPKEMARQRSRQDPDRSMCFGGFCGVMGKS